MKAIILARVSTKEQEEGHSIAAQRQRLVDYCARKGLAVVKTSRCWSLPRLRTRPWRLSRMPWIASSELQGIGANR